MKKKCFFITPIGTETSEEYKKLNALTQNVLNHVLARNDYELIVAHKIHSIGSIGDQVFQSIIDSDLIISNLTGLNPNVMYETAVAHSFGKPTIMISENTTKLPFDLIGDRTIFFNDSIEGTGKLISELEKKVTSIEDEVIADNPIIRVLDKVAIKQDLVGKNDDLSIIKKLLLDMTENDNKNTHKEANEYMFLIKIEDIDFIENPDYISYQDALINNIQVRIQEDIISININQTDEMKEKHEFVIKINSYLYGDELVGIINSCSFVLGIRATVNLIE